MDNIIRLLRMAHREKSKKKAYCGKCQVFCRVNSTSPQWGGSFWTRLVVKITSLWRVLGRSELSNRAIWGTKIRDRPAQRWFSLQEVKTMTWTWASFLSLCFTTGQPSKWGKDTCNTKGFVIVCKDAIPLNLPSSSRRCSWVLVFSAACMNRGIHSAHPKEPAIIDSPSSVWF